MIRLFYITAILLTSVITTLPSQIQFSRCVTPLTIKYNWPQERYKEGESFSISVPLYNIIPRYGEPINSSRVIQGLGTKRALYDYFMEHKLFRNDKLPFKSHDFEVIYAHRPLLDNDISETYTNFAYVKGPLLKLDTNQ